MSASPPTYVVGQDTIERQRRAADPRASVWVSANAGAGKTKVLSDRVLRLMLAGTAPSRILCLTFTKAAAAEMTIRIFKQLGRWVTLDDAALSAELAALNERPPNGPERARARRLFARAVETPGGLKIETIHAFCERVLHLVPFEAGVPAHFTVLDEAESRDLLAEARAAVLVEAAGGGPDARALAAALAVVAVNAGGPRLTELLDATVADDRLPAGLDGLARMVDGLRTAFGLAPDETAERLRRAILDDGLSAERREAVAGLLARSPKPSDREGAETLRATDLPGSAEERTARYFGFFLTKDGKRRAAFCTRGMGEALAAELAQEADRVLALRGHLLGAEAIERTEALVRLAIAARDKVEAIKRRLGALDFADLIDRALALLGRGIAPWVLYRLDRGVDHVLVDEAQDTNPKQWQILRQLTEEFAAGAGRPVRSTRTVFAVGDPKQSIYSFQGADPRGFETSRRWWRSRVKAAKQRFEDVRLDLSFRSAPAILAAVDHTFRIAAHAKGLTFEDGVQGTSHTSARPDAIGHVEIWPAETHERDEGDPKPWDLPVDQIDPSSPASRAADRVARAVAVWTTEGDESGRVWRPGEILILSAKRGPAFFAVIRALRDAGVRVAGADRLDIGQHIAVNDLAAAGGAALLPENDLVLAAALKSPLVGLDDDDLIRIAADRGEVETLAGALARLTPSDPSARAGHEALATWRALAQAHGPFGFYARLLGPQGGRRRLIERLGGEAADAIDAFLIHAATAETGPESVTLASFLSRFETASHVIKRDLDATGDEVSVMTVHGSKGLEAPLVVLMDGCEVLGQDAALLSIDAGEESGRLLVWSRGRAYDAPAMAQARAAAREAGQEEHNRLLYVAMTRAADRLVIAPFAGRPGAENRPEAWSNMVRRGLAEAGAGVTAVTTPWGEADVFRDDGPPGAMTALEEKRSPPPALPDWLGRAPPAETAPAPPLHPSGLPDDGPMSGASRAAARRRGILVHALLELLPDVADEDRERAGASLLMARGPALSRRDHEAILAEALGVIRHPDLAALFGPGSRAEAPIAGGVRLGDAIRSVEGRIDRLAETGSAIWIADFKTGTLPKGGIPDPHLVQLALYRALLGDLHPGQKLRALIVWTRGPTIVEPDDAELNAALRRALP